MKRFLFALLLISATTVYGFPVQTNTATVTVGPQDGQWDDFSWTWSDYNEQYIDVNFDLTLTGFGIYFRLSNNRNRSGTSYLTLSTNTLSVINGTNVVGSITQTNMPPPGTYYVEILAYSGTVWRTLAQGKAENLWSLMVQTNSESRSPMSTTFIPVSVFTQDGGFLVGTGSTVYQEETGSVAIASMDIYSYIYSESEVDALLSGQSNSLQSQITVNASDILALEGATNAINTRITTAEADIVALEGATNAIALDLTNYVDRAGVNGMTAPLKMGGNAVTNSGGGLYFNGSYEIAPIGSETSTVIMSSSPDTFIGLYAAGGVFLQSDLGSDIRLDSKTPGNIRLRTASFDRLKIYADGHSDFTGTTVSNLTLTAVDFTGSAVGSGLTDLQAVNVTGDYPSITFAQQSGSGESERIGFSHDFGTSYLWVSNNAIYFEIDSVPHATNVLFDGNGFLEDDRLPSSITVGNVFATNALVMNNSTNYMTATNTVWKYSNGDVLYLNP